MTKTYNHPRVPAVLMASLWLVGLWPTAAVTQEPTEKPDTWTAYKVIVDRNMFSRQRGSAERRRRDADREVVTAPDPESYYRLRGIAQENGTFIAFVEDTRRSETLKLRQGDAVARGSIESLDLDSIVFRLEDRTITVAIGQDLLGGQGAVTMSELMQWTPTPSTATGGPPATPAAPSGAEAEILRQLMERRKQELGN
ncbi:MAG TPA: hypothetical protein PLU87_03175 [Sedimentisphaerales bacterium]|nr:hypothetical protein [Sedimentisphaerales bacterium]HRS10024.1 hypothetical protein [Sedimentisphaerales bacterium]HRV46730.1 hypothetical protein [Sedimentisphaerales bacterium]